MASESCEGTSSGNCNVTETTPLLRRSSGINAGNHQAYLRIPGTGESVFEFWVSIVGIPSCGYVRAVCLIVAGFVIISNCREIFSKYSVIMGDFYLWIRRCSQVGLVSTTFYRVCFVWISVGIISKIFIFLYHCVVKIVR